MNTSRSYPATEAQFAALVDMLELEPEIARGHKNSCNARLQTSRFWEKVAPTLNNLGGATKNKHKWMKYWTDKKGSIKKKAAKRSAARRRTGGGFEEVRWLTDTEERVLQILGGEGYAVGDSHLRYSVNQQIITTQSTTSPSILSLQDQNTHQPQENTHTQGGNGDLPCGFYGFEPASPDISPASVEEVVIQDTQSQATRPTEPSISPEPRLSQPHISTNQGPSRQPPSQRRSQMTSLAESFIRLEERRLVLEERKADTDRIAALAWRDMAAASQAAVGILKNISQSYSSR